MFIIRNFSPLVQISSDYQGSTVVFKDARRQVLITAFQVMYDTHCTMFCFSEINKYPEPRNLIFGLNGGEEEHTLCMMKSFRIERISKLFSYDRIHCGL